MLMTNTNLDAIAVHSETWGQQLTSAMNVNGGDVSSATTYDYIIHYITFQWKVSIENTSCPLYLGNERFCYFHQSILPD
jgi:hypothetical protein